MSFTISPTTLSTFVTSGGTKNITITSSDYDWSANTDANWIQLSDNSGTTGTTTINVITEENPFYARTGSVEFVNDFGETKSLTVKQNGNIPYYPPIPLLRVGVTGGTYFNIPFTFKNDDRIVIEGVTISKYAGSGSTLFSYRPKSATSQTFAIGKTSSTGGIGRKTTGIIPFTNSTFLTNSTIEITKTNVKVDGVTQSTNVGKSDLTDGDYIITLFALDSAGTGIATSSYDLISLGAITIYDSSNNIKAKFVPAFIINSSGTLYTRYYDEVSKEIFSYIGLKIYPLDAYLTQFNNIKIGDTETKKLCVGSTEMKRTYLGSSLVALPENEVNYITSGIGLSTPVQNQTKNFFDTGISCKTTTSFRIDGTFRGVSNSGCIVGSVHENDSTDWRFFVTENSVAYFDFNSSRISKAQSFTSGKTLSYTCDNYSLTNNISGTFVSGTTQSTINEDRPIKVFYDSIYLKRLRIWENNTLVFDAQPIPFPYKYSTSTKLTLYDSVSNRVLFDCYYNKSRD